LGVKLGCKVERASFGEHLSVTGDSAATLGHFLNERVVHGKTLAEMGLLSIRTFQFKQFGSSSSNCVHRTILYALARFRRGQEHGRTIPLPDIEPRHHLELSCDPLSFATPALVAADVWLINLSQRLRGTAGRAKPAE
jgi:hypothetical protein